MKQVVNRLTVNLVGGTSLAFSGELDINLSQDGLDVETLEGEVWCFPMSNIVYYHVIPLEDSP